MIKKIINRILLKKALLNNKKSSNKIICYSDSIGVEIIVNGKIPIIGIMDKVNKNKKNNDIIK